MARDGQTTGHHCGLPATRAAALLTPLLETPVHTEQHLFDASQQRLAHRRAVNARARRELRQPARVGRRLRSWISRNDVEEPSALAGKARELLPAQRSRGLAGW